MRQVDQLRTPVPACFTDKDPFDRPREHEVKHRRHRVGVTQVGALDAKVGGPEYRAHLAQGQPGARDARVGIANPIDAVERRGDEESHGAVSRLPGAGGENRLRIRFPIRDNQCARALAIRSNVLAWYEPHRHHRP
jgi:hypothetical protein